MQVTFSLKTLFVMITILAVMCWYVRENVDWAHTTMTSFSGKLLFRNPDRTFRHDDKLNYPIAVEIAKFALSEAIADSNTIKCEMIPHDKEFIEGSVFILDSYGNYRNPTSLRFDNGDQNLMTKGTFYNAEKSIRSDCVVYVLTQGSGPSYKIGVMVFSTQVKFGFSGAEVEQFRKETADRIKRHINELAATHKCLDIVFIDVP